MEILQRNSEINPNTAATCVHQLLESLLDEVFSVEECDIATKGRRLSKDLPADSSQNSITEHRHNSVDAVSLIKKSQPSDNDTSDGAVLVELTLRDAHTHLVQLRCVEQKSSGYCGHYALHNVLCMLEVHNCSTDQQALDFVRQTSSSGSFWRRYWWSIEQLSIRARLEGAWPWTEDYIRTGDMERSFLRHLLNTDPHIRQLSGCGTIVVLQFAYGIIQNSFEEVCEIQQRVDTFRSTPDHAHLLFILGITNHWLGITVYKTGSPCPCGHTHYENGCGLSIDDKINMIILDSNNCTNVTLSDKEILEMVEKSEKERVLKKGKGFDKWRKSMYIQSHKDQRDCLLKIAKCVSGQTDLRQEKAEKYAQQVLNSYLAIVDTPLQNHTPDYYLPLLLSWMDNCYPPQTLREGLIPLVSTSLGCLSVDTRHRLSSWVFGNSTRLEAVSLQGLPSVELFTSMVEHIKTLLQV